MSETERSNRGPRWYNRGVGTFCGGFLGFFFAALVVMLIGDVAVPVCLLAITGGTIVGLAIGYFFPNATETFWSILSIFC